MTPTPLHHIAQLLREVGAPGSFAARRTATADDLHLEVKGVGALRFPVSRTQAQKLCRIARPARYGQGEQTLLDQQVRYTWEVPKSRVKIDRRRWNRTLKPMLDALATDLGLPAGSQLEAELHSLLVYAPGQFFKRHQDSEKTDRMIGTLVVTLPSPFKGGVFVVEHRAESITYRATKKPLSFIAFYADCHHEVRPVKEGYRIVLTYNLMVEGDAAAAVPQAETVPLTVDALAQRLREHFETPLPPRYTWGDQTSRKSPDRLVYLLDHQYTERGFGWDRLKGDDAARVAALRAAAERAGCDVMLALAEIQETWSCFEAGWDQPEYGRHRRWERDEDDEWYEEDEPPSNVPDAYDLGELIDSGITLDHWLDASGKKAQPILTHLADDEVCAATPSVDLEPYASEYEGYMGNWGNTMDRWYRRAAIVLWPREREFVIRAEASPSWALTTLRQRIRAGDLAEAREMATSLLPFWKAGILREQRSGFFDRVLRVAEGLEAPKLAASLLETFPIEALTPKAAKALLALVERYGEDWARSQVSLWSRPDRPWRLSGPHPLAWIASLPDLCEALTAANTAAGTATARLLLEGRWAELETTIEESRKLDPPSQRSRALAELAAPILGFLGAAAVIEAADLRDQAVRFLSATDNEPLLPCVVQTLRASVKTVKPEKRGSLGLEALRQHCIRILETRLALPARSKGDWSIALPAGCKCELCSNLGAFLADPEQSRLEWPLAQNGRQHVHGRIDRHELPVRHQTRRSGRPYTLVLTKTKALFESEAAERKSWQADLAWLGRLRVG